MIILGCTHIKTLLYYRSANIPKGKLDREMLLISSLFSHSSVIH